MCLGLPKHGDEGEISAGATESRDTHLIETLATPSPPFFPPPSTVFWDVPETATAVILLFGRPRHIRLAGLVAPSPCTHDPLNL